MARPIKTGLDYFSFDVDFYDNRKVRKVVKGCGPSSGSILSCLLCNIYRWKGYYILVDVDLPFDIADSVGVSEGAVTEVIMKALQVGFFDKAMYDKHMILTSFEIQKRYRSGTLKRTEIQIDARFSITEVNNIVIDGINEVNDARSTQSIVKYSKGKESKEDRAKALVIAGDDGKYIRELKKKYNELIECLAGKEVQDVWVAIKNFIVEQKPDWLEPYADLWNVFAPRYQLSKLVGLSESRRKKFTTRLTDPMFDFIRILEKIKNSPHLKGDNSQGWKCSFDWIIENDKNYLKIIEGNYD